MILPKLTEATVILCICRAYNCYDNSDNKLQEKKSGKKNFALLYDKLCITEYFYIAVIKEVRRSKRVDCSHWIVNLMSPHF